MMTRRRGGTTVHLTVVAVIVVTVLGVGVATVAGAQTGDSGTSEHVGNDTVAVVITFESDAARGPSPVRAVGGQVTGGGDVDVVLVLFAEVPESALLALRNASGVDDVERDRTVHTVGTVDSGTLAGAGRDGVTVATDTTWGYERIDATTANDAVGTGVQSAVDVAVLDTGVDTDHPQL